MPAEGEAKVANAARTGGRFLFGTKMNAVIVANGELHKSARLQNVWQNAALRIAADGGARHARVTLGRAPQLAIGDMDSMDAETRAWLASNAVEWIQHPRAKDETDLELAVRVAQERGADEILVLGAAGGRADHFLANVMLLTQLPHLKILDAAAEMWVSETRAEVQGARGDVVSLIPLDTRVEGITTSELEYPLRGETLERGSTRGVSNVMLDARAEVTWTRGAMLIVHLFHSAEA
jgi:thiamine pyrophosphokinase